MTVRDILDVATKYSYVDGYGLNILAVPCRACHAPAHSLCINKFGHQTLNPHSIRFGLARKVAGIQAEGSTRQNSKSLVWPHNVF